MSRKNAFTENETLAGYITVTSGSLMLSDSVWDSSQIHKDSKLNIDLEEDNISLKIPVTTIRQNGKRYILIAIDSAIPSIADPEKLVEVEQSDPEDTEDTEDEA